MSAFVLIAAKRETRPWYSPSVAIQKYCQGNSSLTHDILNSESRTFSYIVEKSFNQTVIDYNFGRHNELSTLKSDIHLGLTASVNITFSAR